MQISICLEINFEISFLTKWEKNKIQLLFFSESVIISI
jgi:hypothetical protein